MANQWEKFLEKIRKHSFCICKCCGYVPTPLEGTQFYGICEECIYTIRKNKYLFYGRKYYNQNADKLRKYFNDKYKRENDCFRNSTPDQILSEIGFLKKNDKTINKD